jgi:hypothetical protein
MNKLKKISVLQIRIRRIPMFLDLPDPVRGTDPDLSIIKQKIMKNLDFYGYCL